MFYSKSTNSWYPAEFRADYEAAGTWPDDAKEYPLEVYQAMVSYRAPNQIIQPDENGDPALVDAPPPPQQYKTEFGSLEFIDLFTDAEQLAIVGATMQSAQIKLWYDKMLGANFVSLNDERTIAGLNALVAAQLITAARKKIILTPQVVQP